MFALEFLGASNAGCAEVDAGDLRFRPAHRVLSSLGCPAAGNENRMVFPIRSARPEEMIIRTAFLLALPMPAVFFETIDREGIGI